MPCPTVSSVKQDRRKNNRGSDSRKSKFLKFRKRIVDKYEELSNLPSWRRPKNMKKTMSGIFKTSPSNIQRYWKDREIIRGFWADRVASRNRERGSRSLADMRRMPRKQRGKFDNAECILYDEFRDKRKKGYKVGGLWLRLRFKQLVMEKHSKEVKGTRSWLYRWSARFKVTCRRRTAYKAPVKDRLPKIKRWHARLLRRLKRGKQVDAADGRWRLQNRFNVDQVPACFADPVQRTYHAKEDGERVIVQLGRDAAAKRECTLQLCCRYVGKEMASTQPRAAIIFRGKGLRISAEEREQWDKRVDVYFQPRAWLDKYINAEWTERTFAPCTSYHQNQSGGHEESVVFTDNLSTQTTEEWRKQLWKSARTKSHLFPTGVTDELQTIDDGVGWMTKHHMGEAWTRWIETTAPDGQSNLERMVASEVSASEKRVLLSKFLGDAWDHVTAKYDFLYSGEKNGCTLDVDGTQMSKIKLQGLEECYTFTAADAGESAASSADEEEEDTENEGTDCDTEEMGEIEVVSESEPDSDDASEEEGPQNVDDHGNFEVPDGMHVLPKPPVNFSVASLKAFKLKIALKWPFGDEFGWEIGKIIKLVTHAGRHKGSFVIRFEDGIEWYWPKLRDFQYGGTKAWVLIAETET